MYLDDQCLGEVHVATWKAACEHAAVRFSIARRTTRDCRLSGEIPLDRGDLAKVAKWQSYGWAVGIELRISSARRWPKEAWRADGDDLMPLLPETAPGEKLVMKVWGSFCSAVSGLASPMQIRREGRARTDVRRHEMLALAQVQEDIAAIRAGKKRLDDKGRLLLNTASVVRGSGNDLEHIGQATAGAKTSALLDLSRLDIDLQALQQACNLRKIVLYAEQEAEQVPDEEVSDEPINPDWFVRWREAAQSVSMEQMQRLWARMASGEIAQPGTLSLRTMSFLRDLSQTEITSISKVARVAIKQFIYKSDLDGSNLTSYFQDLMKLEELDLALGVTSLGGLQRSISSTSRTDFEALLVCNKAVFLVRKEGDPTAVLDFPIYGITQVGYELMLLGKFEADMEYLIAMGKDISKRGFSVQIGEYERRFGAEIQLRRSHLSKIEV